MERTAPVRVEDHVASGVRPEPDVLRDSFLAALPGLTLGLVRTEGGAIRAGRLALLRLGLPERVDGAWRRQIEGGLLARAAGGSLTFGWREGDLYSVVDGYRPALPGPLYRATQLRVHHALTRRHLLAVRGRVPPAGVPAGPAQRLAAGALDVAVCAAVTRLLEPGRRRWPATFAAVAAAYHVGLWTTVGATPGGRLLGLRVAAVDGSRPDLLQAAVRLLLIPVAAVRRRAVHDQAAQTEVLEDSSPTMA